MQLIYSLRTHNKYCIYNDINLAILSYLNLIKNNIDNIIFERMIINSNIVLNEYTFDPIRLEFKDASVETIRVDKLYIHPYNKLIDEIKMARNNNKMLINDSKVHEIINKEKLKNKMDEIKEYITIETDKYVKNNEEYVKRKEEMELIKKKNDLEIDNMNQKRNDFFASKKTYFLLKNDITIGKITEDIVSILFKDKYIILKEMDSINLISNNDDNENYQLINKQIKYYFDQLESAEEIAVINAYKNDKNKYYSIKDDIINNNMYKEDIDMDFSEKYLIFESMDESKLLDNNNDVINEFNEYISLYDKLNSNDFL